MTDLEWQEYFIEFMKVPPGEADICQVHKNLWDRLVDDTEGRRLAVKAYIMGRRMSASIRRHNGEVGIK